jgi:chromosome segregation ATPase
MERQLLEINDAFAAFVGDVERQRRDALERQSATENRLRDAEDRLLTVDRQKQDVERQLRKLQRTLAVRLVRFLGRSNPLRSPPERVG